MKKYLSKTWIATIIVYVGIIIGEIGIWITVGSVDEYKTNTSIFLIDFFTFSPVIILVVFLIILALKQQIKKICFSKNEITMFSFKKETTTVDLNQEVFYEIINIRVDKYSSDNFILISNKPFVLPNNLRNLGFYCKYIDKNKMKIVIAPYNKQTLPWLNIKDWIDLGDK